MARKAYCVSVDGFPDCVAAASTRGKAIAVAWGGVRDAGYRYAFTDIRAVRWPKYDGWAARQVKDRYATTEFVATEIPVSGVASRGVAVRH